MIISEKTQNIHQILTKKKGNEWLWINKDDVITKITTWYGKVWYVISNLFQGNKHHKRLAKIISGALLELNSAENPEDKAKFVGFIDELYKSMKPISWQVSRYLKDDVQKQLRKKTINLAIDALDLLKLSEETNPSYMNIIKTIHYMITSSNLPFYKEINLDSKKLENLKEKVKAIRVFDPTDKTTKNLYKILDFPHLIEAEAFHQIKNPEMTSAGASGTYLVSNRVGKTCGIFKPDDEVPGGHRNPKNIGDICARITCIDPMTYGVREEIAYHLDRGCFAGIPKTKHVTFSKIRLSRGKTQAISGSFQAFVPDTEMLCDRTKERQEKLSVKEIQKIAIFDMRTLNADRHFGNLLVDKEGHLHPIDHGMILPLTARRLVFEWMNLSQVKKPIDADLKHYISLLNPEEDAKYLRSKGIEEAAIQRMIISTCLLKIGVKKDLTLWEIARLMQTGISAKKIMKWKTGNRSHDSYFETQICKRILGNGGIRDSVLEEVIEEYKENHTQHIKNPEPFKKFGWTKGKKYGEGLHYYRFFDVFKGVPQKVHVMKLDDPVNGDFRLQIVDHRDHKEDAPTPQPREFDPRVPIVEVATKIPGAVAMINGGFYHYNLTNYAWPHDRFRVGDPAGVLKVCGKMKKVTLDCENSDNLPLNLWGLFAISIDGEPSIVKTEPGTSNTIANTYHQALGSGPVLIKNGDLTPITKKVQRLAEHTFKHATAFEKFKILLNTHAGSDPPGDFGRHYHKRHPRTCIAKTANGEVFLMTVEGKRNGVTGAAGMTCEELAEFAKSIGAVDALNLDGGGSAAMLAKDASSSAPTLLNQSAEAERPITSSIAFVRRKL